jgi:hypothetical protein
MISAESISHSWKLIDANGKGSIIRIWWAITLRYLNRIHPLTIFSEIQRRPFFWRLKIEQDFRRQNGWQLKMKNLIYVKKWKVIEMLTNIRIKRFLSCYHCLPMFGWSSKTWERVPLTRQTVIWLNTRSYDMTWYDMIWYDMIIGPDNGSGRLWMRFLISSAW